MSAHDPLRNERSLFGDVDPRYWITFARPEGMGDPLREIWYRIHRLNADEPYSPSNVEARFLCERLSEAKNERNRFEGALRVIGNNASSWHGDDEAKARVLAVIVETVKEALRV